MRHFRFLLEGRRSTAFVDHKPLAFAITKATAPWSERQQWQLSGILEFMTDIQHVSGKVIPVADYPSQAPISIVHLVLDYAAMAADQLDD